LLLAWGGAVSAQPSSLWLHSAIYDPVRQRMILFGGTPDSQILENEVWQLTLGNAPSWSQVNPTGILPSGRLGHSAIYDPVRDRMIVFGGLDGMFQIVSDVWALSLTDGTWSQLQPSGAPPPGRRYHTAIYDPVRDRMVVFGGDGGFGNLLRDTWSLWLSPSPRWERIVPNGSLPTIRYGHSAIYDRWRDRMLVFGGSGPSNDLWALTFADTTWNLLASTGTLPTPRYGQSAVYDAGGDRMIAFGGSDGNQFLDEVWLLSLASPAPSWSRFFPTSPSPSVRQFHTAIYDSVFRRMLVFGGSAGAGGQAGVADPTWALSLGSEMHWSPERPVINVAPSSIDLPIVTVGDTVSVAFSISNVGLQPLQIQALQLPVTDLRISAPAPPSMFWNTAVAETLWLAARVPGVLNDSLVIVSNDPLVPRRQVSLHLDVRGLDFTTRVLGEPDSVPPGVSFIVVVTPQPGVTVERGTLYYRIADGSSPFDSLALTPLATDYIAAIPASAVTEHGVDYFIRVENSGFSAARPVNAPVSWLTQNVGAPAALPAVIPRPTSGSDFLAGLPIEVDVELPDGAVVESGRLDVRRGGDAGFQSLPLSPTGISGQLAGVIPDSLVGPRGVEYRAVVKTLRAMLVSPPAPDLAAIRVRVPILTEPSAHAGGHYRLLSVPLDFGADFSGSLDALLADNLGSYDPTRWRTFVYDPSTQSNVEFSSQQAARFRPEPGRAFWLISRDDHRVDTQPIAGFSTPTSGDYPLSLSAGWNLIGNPFDFPVQWIEVGGDTALTGDPVAFDPSLGSIGDYSDASPAVLEPFAGYWVHATQVATLRLPPHAAPVPLQSSAAPRSRLAVEEGWRVRIRARTDAAEDGSNVIGLSPEAGIGYDPLDLLKPPIPPGSWVRAGIEHPDWGEKAGEYRRDLRPPGADGQTWELEIRSGARGEAITLDLSELVAAPPGLAVSLLDREQGTAIPWPSASGGNLVRAPLEHRIVSFGARPYRLALAAGTEDYVRQASDSGLAMPGQTLLEQNAPNPFGLATRLRFGLSRPGHVTLRIYGLGGERVASPVESCFLVAGYHTVVWDGRRSSGDLAPSGIYLARLEIDGRALTRRLVLVR
jgi:hypothetical protein